MSKAGRTKTKEKEDGISLAQKTVVYLNFGEQVAVGLCKKHLILYPRKVYVRT